MDWAIYNGNMVVIAVLILKNTIREISGAVTVRDSDRHVIGAYGWYNSIRQ